MVRLDKTEKGEDEYEYDEEKGDQLDQMFYEGYDDSLVKQQQILNYSDIQE